MKHDWLRIAACWSWGDRFVSKMLLSLVASMLMKKKLHVEALSSNTSMREAETGISLQLADQSAQLLGEF